MARSRTAWILGALALSFLVGCNVITEEMAETPTEPEPVSTVSPISIPVVLPASNPTPTPEPSPSVEPDTPTPSPTPPPSTEGACGAPPAGSPAHSCSMGSPLYRDKVEKAITRVTEKHPNLFNFSDKKCPDCYLVKNVDAYIDRVLEELASQGLCAIWDGEEVAVKKNNDLSEQYDIILSSLHIRRGDGSYRATCYPAWF